MKNGEIDSHENTVREWTFNGSNDKVEFILSFSSKSGICERKTVRVRVWTL